MLLIENQIIDVVVHGEAHAPCQAHGAQHGIGAGQAADHDPVSPEQGGRYRPVVAVLHIKNQHLAIEGLQLFALLFNPVKETLGQGCIGEQ